MVQSGIGSAVANEFESGKRYIRYTTQVIVTKQDVATSGAVGATTVLGSITSSNVCELTVRADRCAPGPGRDRRCILRRVYPVYFEITAGKAQSWVIGIERIPWRFQRQRPENLCR